MTADCGPLSIYRRYASLGAHEEKDQSRKDDLESLLYVFLDLYLGKLPWAEHVSDSESHFINLLTCFMSKVFVYLYRAGSAVQEHIRCARFIGR